MKRISASLLTNYTRTCLPPSLQVKMTTSVVQCPLRHMRAPPRLTSPTDRPWWMATFAPQQNPAAKGSARLSAPNATSQGEPLPAWPVDETEFNARLPDGGHGARLAAEESAMDSEGGGASRPDGATHDDATSLVAAPLTEEQRQAVLKVATTTEAGQKAVARGGWVCGTCLTPMPYRARSICDGCRALRHDAETTVRGWRTDPENWTCGLCHEFNFPHDAACRCCATPRAECHEVRAVHHERVADEVRHAAIGSVLNVRNRVCRWQCSACEEINSLQGSVCRNCGGDRFALTLRCPGCQSTQRLDNRRVYGNEVQDQRHYQVTFGVHNCFPRLAPTQTCGHCSGSLHGATIVSLPRPAWLCACGNGNNGARVSCLRCRLPRTIPNPATLRRLLTVSPVPSRTAGGGGNNGASSTRAYDVEGCTNWLCESCEDEGGGVNMASRFVVGLTPARPGQPRATQGTSSKAARMVHGDARCRSCGAPWHHQQLRDGGRRWRCACHMINRQEDTKCSACGLPARDGIRVDILSQWTRGDWLCEACGRHNYRDRPQCICGVRRSRSS